MGAVEFSAVDYLERYSPLFTLHLSSAHVLMTSAVQSCTQLANGSYTKDLSLVESDLARVCLIDNSPISYNVNPGMTFPFVSFIFANAMLLLPPFLACLPNGPQRMEYQ